MFGSVCRLGPAGNGNSAFVRLGAYMRRSLYLSLCLCLCLSFSVVFLALDRMRLGVRLHARLLMLSHDFSF